MGTSDLALQWFLWIFIAAICSTATSRPDCQHLHEKNPRAEPPLAQFLIEQDLDHLTDLSRQDPGFRARAFIVMDALGTGSNRLSEHQE